MASLEEILAQLEQTDEARANPVLAQKVRDSVSRVRKSIAKDKEDANKEAFAQARRGYADALKSLAVKEKWEIPANGLTFTIALGAGGSPVADISLGIRKAAGRKPGTGGGNGRSSLNVKTFILADGSQVATAAAVCAALKENYGADSPVRVLRKYVINHRQEAETKLAAILDDGKQVSLWEAFNPPAPAKQPEPAKTS